ncbi:hypothetical protein COCON_G00167420 [Conger conger]|uniref:SPIN-DOC-like zinc-finger domain-containing protein n=1 Tax=Conger conger TaxID=82655 RepID=A0A9Q1HTD1_CONCO|nr:hypothetical protein COCON_G00167420 [Conger conger]
MALLKRKIWQEHRQFQEKWTVDYFFVEDNGNATCLICREKVAVLKKYNLERHYATKHAEHYSKYQGDEREKTASQLRKLLVFQQNLSLKRKKESEAAVLASYAVSEMIAKAGKPYKDGEFIKACMVKVSEIVCPEHMNIFSNISLSANTVAERIAELANDIDQQLGEKGKAFSAYSVALAVSADVGDNAPLAIFVRGVNDNFDITEELLSLGTVHGCTTPNDIFCHLSDVIERAGLPWHALAGITTDGVPAMTDEDNGLVAQVQRKVREENGERPVALHALISQQQILCCKCARFEKVMSVVVKCVNYIRSRGSQHHQFRALLDDIESNYGDLQHLNEVRWFSRGTVLNRFFELRTTVQRFMGEINLTVAEFEDARWVMDLAFLVDITHELNILNLKLQYPGQTVTAMFDCVRAFTTKLKLWECQLSQNNFAHFPACKSLLGKLHSDMQFCGTEYALVLKLLLDEFDRRFADFSRHRDALQMFADPFSVDVETAPSHLQMELIDLQCNTALKNAFKEAQGDIAPFHRQIKPSFPQLCKSFQRTLCMFGSTYMYDKLFSTLNLNKSKQRTRLTDSHLSAILKVSTAESLKPNINRLSELKRCQFSGKR